MAKKAFLVGINDYPGSGSDLKWAGCRDNQTSADAFIKGSYNGAPPHEVGSPFTYFFCKHVRDTEGKVTRSELLKRLRASLRHEGYDQVPQLEGAAGAKKKPLFA